MSNQRTDEVLAQDMQPAQEDAAIDATRESAYDAAWESAPNATRESAHRAVARQDDILAQIGQSTAAHVKVAGAGGTGKSEAIVRRVACLISRGVDPDEVLVCASTLSAADEMSRRIARLDVA